MLVLTAAHCVEPLLGTGLEEDSPSQFLAQGEGWQVCAYLLTFSLSRTHTLNQKTRTRSTLFLSLFLYFDQAIFNREKPCNASCPINQPLDIVSGWGVLWTDFGSDVALIQALGDNYEIATGFLHDIGVYYTGWEVALPASPKVGGDSCETI